MNLKDRIKELRHEKGISAPALAERLGKAESTVRTWETGRAKPDADTLMILAGIFDCSVDYLLGLTTDLEARGKSIVIHKELMNTATAQLTCVINDLSATPEIINGILETIN